MVIGNYGMVKMMISRFETDKVYIVAEVGQNHNGNVRLAKDLIDDASLAGCSAIKLTKRDIASELTDEAYKRIYDSKNAFARTYGKHREFLELSFEDHRLLKKYANNRGMDYFISFCDIPSLEFAIELEVPLLKLPSKEITNLPLLHEMIKKDKPIAFSIGLATKKTLERAAVLLINNDAIMVVCTSEYPTEVDNVNLNRILEYPRWKKGFSSHIPDPTLGIAAVAMGAKYIEYHITLDREMKGTDQSVSLELDEMLYMVDAIKNLTIALGDRKIPEKLPKYLQYYEKKLMKKECEDGIWRIH